MKVSDLGKKSNNVANDLHRDTKDLEKKGNTLFQLLSGTNSNLGGDGDKDNGTTFTVSNAVPFSAVGGTNRNVPFIAAIVTENGQARVYIREGDEETQILTVGDDWGGWTIEVIEAARVYFSSADEEFDYFVFATLGQE